MSKFIKIIVNKNEGKFLNIEYLPNIITLYEKFSRYIHDDYFLENKSIVDAVINLVEKTTPFFWGILDKKNEKFAGFCFLENLTGNSKNLHSADITTCFEPEFWGNYTKKCAQKFIKYCFKKYKFEKLKAYIFPQNSRVKALLKKSGFKKEALLKAETYKNGILQDIEIYSLIKTSNKKEI